MKSKKIGAPEKYGEKTVMLTERVPESKKTILKRMLKKKLSG